MSALTGDIEDNEHVWICPKSKDIQEEIWADAIYKISDCGRATTHQHNVALRRRSKKDQTVTPPIPATWTLPFIYDTFQQTIQWPSILDNRATFEIHSTWTVYGPYRCLVPEPLITVDESLSRALFI